MAKRIGILVLAVIPALIFLQSLVFKFLGAPDTKQIFGLIEHSFANWGLPGLFVGGPFQATTVGIVELIAASLLIAGIFRPALQAIGALVGLLVMSGAIFFHLFTDLGVNVPFVDGTACPLIDTVEGGTAASRSAILSTQGCAGDPTLFAMAVVTFLCCLGLVIIRRNRLPLIAQRKTRPA